MNKYRPFITKKVGYVVFAIVVLSVLVVVWLQSDVPPETGIDRPASDTSNASQPDNEGFQSDSSFVGLTESQAIEKADNEDIAHRIEERDGESLPLTMDYNEDRINFTIEDGLVVKAEYY